MRRTLLLLFASVCLFSQADTAEIVLTQKGSQHDREGRPLCFDMPLAYYFYDNKTQDIIIDGNGVVSYYDVETGEVRFCGGFKVDKGVNFSVKTSSYNK